MRLSASCHDPTLNGPAAYKGRTFTAPSLEVQPAFSQANGLMVFPFLYPHVLTNPIGNQKLFLVWECGVGAVPMGMRGGFPEMLNPGPLMIMAQVDTTAATPTGGVRVPAIGNSFGGDNQRGSTAIVTSAQSHVDNGGVFVAGTSIALIPYGSNGALILGGPATVEPQPFFTSFAASGCFVLGPGCSIMIRGPFPQPPNPPMVLPSGTLRFSFTWQEIPFEEAKCLLV